MKNRKIRASAEEPRPSRYHPFEEVAEPELIEGGEARLTLAERTRTIIEVLLFQLGGENGLFIYQAVREQLEVRLCSTF